MICDLAETYHIYDYHTVDPKTLTVLVQGLGPNTRLGQKIAGLKAPLDTILLAVLVDDINSVLNALSKHPKKYKSIAEELIGKPVKTDGFSTPQELENKLDEIRRKHGG